MKKILVIAIILIVLSVGCSNKYRGTQVQQSTPMNKVTEINENISKQTAKINIKDTTNNFDKNSFGNFVPNFEGIKEIMLLKKENVLENLGKNYEVVSAGAEGSDEGYYYSEFGITIIFDSFLEPDMIAYIECNYKVDIKGAKLGMTFSEIKEILGDGQSRDLEQIDPTQPSYTLYYNYDNFIVWFGSTEKDGCTTHLQIRRNYM